MYNPIEDAISKSNEASGQQEQVSTSALLNDVVGQCPKCKQTFESATVDEAPVFYCPGCRVASPMPDNVVG